MQHRDPVASPELRAANAARKAQQLLLAQHEAPLVAPAVKDPLPLCVYATVALLAWLFSPPLTVAAFAALGLRAYWRAWRAGLRRSSCFLRDPRLVMLYLAVLLVAGLVWPFL